MKKTSLLLTGTFFLLINLLYAQEGPPTFGSTFAEYGWVKMQQEGYDYETITRYARNFYSDTLTQNDSTKKFKHYLRWLSYWMNRVYSTDAELENGKKGLFYHNAVALNNSIGQNPCPGSNHPDSDWESWGFDTQPLLNGQISGWGGMGIMWTVKVDTADHNLQTLYAGSPLGGVWKTTDQGLNWTNVTDVMGVPGLSISHIAISPHDNQHILVGTGQYWGTAPGIGIIESKDGGNTWTTTGFTNTQANSKNQNVMEVHFHPKDTSKYFALMDNKILLSLDRGATWDSVLFNAPNSLNMETMKFHPTNLDTIYVSSRGSDARLYRTFNGGSNWTDITNNFNTGAIADHFITIDVSPTDPDALWVGMIKKENQSSDRYRVYKSFDLGNTSVQRYAVSSPSLDIQSPNKTFLRFLLQILTLFSQEA